MSISPDRILYEDEHLLVVNKRAGELVVRGKGPVGKLPLLDLLRKQYPGLRAVHRLDFDTSGAVVFARTRQAAERIKETKFSGWQKVYRALVAGRMQRESGIISAPLPARTEGTVPALTCYRVLQRFANSTLVEATIETGRHHQIRRHFAGIGYPLMLDHLYGDARYNRVFTQEFKYRRFFLHAVALTFPHPVTGKPLHIAAPLPRVFADILKELAL